MNCMQEHVHFKVSSFYSNLECKRGCKGSLLANTLYLAKQHSLQGVGSQVLHSVFWQRRPHHISLVTRTRNHCKDQSNSHRMDLKKKKKRRRNRHVFWQFSYLLPFFVGSTLHQETLGYILGTLLATLE